MVNQIKAQEIIDQELPQILKLKPNVWFCIGIGYEDFNRIAAGKRIVEMLKMMGFMAHWHPMRFSVRVSNDRDPWVSIDLLEELKGYTPTHYIIDELELFSKEPKS